MILFFLPSVVFTQQNSVCARTELMGVLTVFKVLKCSRVDWVIKLKDSHEHKRISASESTYLKSG